MLGFCFMILSLFYCSSCLLDYHVLYSTLLMLHSALPLAALHPVLCLYCLCLSPYPIPFPKLHALNSSPLVLDAPTRDKGGWVDK